MYLSFLFWLGLALPGYVLVRHLWKEDIESGLLGTLGLSYLAVFGLLSPVSILCYLFRAPLAVFSGACVLAVVAASVEITRRGWWRDLVKLLTGGLSAGLLLVFIDMVMGTMVGGHIGGDGALHLTKIRQLLDHGFNNQDPFVSGSYFFAIYHTNIYHAFHAACSQITGVHHVSVWFLGLTWAKLLVASGAYYMAWAVFGRRWPAWIAAAFVVGCQGPVTFVLYPNKLAPYWVVPMMIGFVVQACRSHCGWRYTWRSTGRYAIKIAIGSLVLGQLHSLYGAFAGIAMVPVLGVFAISSAVRNKVSPWPIVACVLSLFAALPFLLVSKQESNPTARTAAAVHPGDQADASVPPRNKAVKGFRYFDNGSVMMNARFGWGMPRSIRSVCITACLALGILAGLVGNRRSETVVFLAIIGTVVLILRTPLLCTWALRVFHREWILSRFGIFLYLGYVVLVPAAIASLLESKTRFWWVRSLLTVGVAIVAVPFIQHSTKDYSWPGYFENIQKPAAERYKHLTRTVRIVEFCRKHIVPGSTVLIEDVQGMVLTSIHDCHVVAPKTSGNGISDIGQRRADLKILLSPSTPWPSRRELLRKYNVKYFFPAGAPTGWVRGHLMKVHPLGSRSALYVLDLDT